MGTTATFFRRAVPVVEVKRDSFRLTTKLAAPGYARVNFAIICTGDAAKYNAACGDELVVASGPKSLPAAKGIAPATLNLRNIDTAMTHGQVASLDLLLLCGKITTRGIVSTRCFSAPLMLRCYSAPLMIVIRGYMILYNRMNPRSNNPLLVCGKTTHRCSRTTGKITAGAIVIATTIGHLSG
jgi:hypothetical protein